MKDNKSELIAIRLTPIALAKLDAIAKDEGVSRSEALRRALEAFGVPVIGKVSGANNRVTLIQADGEHIDVTPEELAVRE